MRHPRFYKFLLWAGPAFLVAVVAVLTLIAAFASAFPDFAQWIRIHFSAIRTTVSLVWFITVPTLLFLLWIALVVCSSRPPRPESLPAESPSLTLLKRAAETLRASAPMSFREMAQHVAFNSQWAESYTPKTDAEKWRGDLKTQICSPLIEGRIEAKGTRHIKTRGSAKPVAENGPTAIPASFWRSAKFSPAVLLWSGLDMDDEACGQGQDPDVAWVDRGDTVEFFYPVTFDRSAVEREWPSRSPESIAARPSAFVAFAARDEEEGDSQLFDFWWEYWTDQRDQA